MNAAGLSVLLASALAFPAAHAHKPRTYTVTSTAYTTDCGSGGGTVTASGYRVRFGQVANNFLPFGTKLRLMHPRSIRGRRHFYVRDRIGWGSELDFWMPSCRQAIRWGRRTVKFRVVPRG